MKLVVIAVAALAISALAFTLSASVGLGGSLLLVPGMALLFGAKKGVALAALLLACNNVGKVIVYRRHIPFEPALGVILLTTLGVLLGAGLLVSQPEAVITIAVIVGIVSTLVTERLQLTRVRRGSAPILSFVAGAFSGFTGTSGPLKGLALRNLDLDRQRFVGAASAVSLAADATKVAVFTQAELLLQDDLWLLLGAIPLIVVSVLIGRRINVEVGERGYTVLFWLVMSGYSVRLIL